jgi:hypothetical protein
LERSIDCRDRRCDRKFKPLVLGQIQTAADTSGENDGSMPGDGGEKYNSTRLNKALPIYA